MKGILIRDCLSGSNFTWSGIEQSHNVCGRLSERNKILAATRDEQEVGDD